MKFLFNLLGNMFNEPGVLVQVGKLLDVGKLVDLPIAVKVLSSVPLDSSALLVAGGHSVLIPRLKIGATRATQVWISPRIHFAVEGSGLSFHRLSLRIRKGNGPKFSVNLLKSGHSSDSAGLS